MTAEKAQNIRPTPLADNELPPREKIILDPFSDGDEGGEEEPGDLVEGEDEASDGVAAGGTKLSVLPDGALSPIRAEVLALARADGFLGHEAWEVSGGGSASYRKRMERNPLFGERVEVLVAEKTKLEDLGMLGEAFWAVKQNWRLARASGDVATIHRATLLLVETTKLVAAAQGASIDPPPADGEEDPGGDGTVRLPGRPPRQPKQLSVDTIQMRDKLLHKGLAPAVPVEAG